MFGDMQSGSCAAEPRSSFSPERSGGEGNSRGGASAPSPAAVSQPAMLPRLEVMNGAKKAIVIGGGPAGLVAATRLAEGGVETTVLEAASHFGGRATSERRGGFVLNQGPHALYAGGPAMRELRAMGVELSWWNPTSPNSVFVRDGKATRGPGGTLGLARLLRPLLRDR